MSEKMKYPKWGVGNWWIVSVKQRAIWLKSPEVHWVGPFHLRFQVIREDEDSYVLEVTYPDRPESIAPKRAEVWFSKRDFRFVKGTIYLGENEIPMEQDFLAKVHIDHPPGVDLRGKEAEEQITKGPEDRFRHVLKTFIVKTPTGGTQVSSPELPYHLRIQEEDYTLELESWGSREGYTTWP
ncbi:MAG: hypothetical protein IMF11_01340 [Proteobacteria bacterium]|nr:hypothetical protein [Pseudomonadota bacterium]